MLHFDTDYMEGAHPDIMAALAATNLEQTAGYGSDCHTLRAEKLILRACGLTEGHVHFLVGGTQTNATVIDALLGRCDGVVACDTAHINVHEAGAIEATGHKVITLPAHDGKLRAEDVERYVSDYRRDDTCDHIVRPAMVYISHPTELGTVYSLAELEALSSVCRRLGLPLYLDGARLAYGLAAEGTDVSLKDVARLCDVFYIGGTKCGCLFGEAVVATRAGLLPRFLPLTKLHGALLAKGRLLGVQFETLFASTLYQDLGRRAVSLALKIRRAFEAGGYAPVVQSPTNQQFFRLPNAVIDRLQQAASFELWGPRGETETVVRFVTSWATREEDVDALIAML